MAALAFILSIGLMVPFFVWGFRTLRERYVYHEDIPRRVEVVTLCGVALFFAVQLTLLRAWMGSLEMPFFFTALGLVVASTALYGPMLVSVASWFLVDLVHPHDEHDLHRPHFAPAEALEEAGNYEGALREYMVMARVFPKDGETAVRTADALAELGRNAEAARSFERGLSLIDDPERALLITNRLADIYQRRLDRPDEAARVLHQYIDAHPQSDRVETARRRLERLTAAPAPARDPSTELLDSPRADPWG